MYVTRLRRVPHLSVPCPQTNCHRLCRERTPIDVLTKKNQ